MIFIIVTTLSYGHFMENLLHTRSFYKFAAYSDESKSGTVILIARSDYVNCPYLDPS